ncbi:hypothetical protein MATL_G00233660 [Megalops atlanticus]|uniref:Uncharacterized protein n=1 Tax=Megalops atlanticus TaxID=7932 RepID=A0A9D3PDW7_MEGAT|nr:hypothetical protein MATL_G00233660 [Megalops atlanticus]
MPPTQRQKEDSVSCAGKPSSHSSSSSSSNSSSDGGGAGVIYGYHRGCFYTFLFLNIIRNIGHTPLTEKRIYRFCLRIGSCAA